MYTAAAVAFAPMADPNGYTGTLLNFAILKYCFDILTKNKY
jgi:hypothetical protein